MLGSRLVVLPLSTSRKGRDELASLQKKAKITI